MRYILLIVFLTGCDFYTDGHQIHNAIENCKDHDGVDYISNITRNAKCMDGSTLDTRKRSKK